MGQELYGLANKSCKPNDNKRDARSEAKVAGGNCTPLPTRDEVGDVKEEPRSNHQDNGLARMSSFEATFGENVQRR